MVNTIRKNQSHKHAVNQNYHNIIRWYDQGASNHDVARRLNISIAALHRHTAHWKIKKIPKHRIYKETKKLKPVSNEIKHLAVSAKWTKAAF